MCLKHGIVINMGLIYLAGIFTIEQIFEVFSCTNTYLIILYPIQEFSDVLDVYNFLAQVGNA